MMTRMCVVVVVVVGMYLCVCFVMYFMSAFFNNFIVCVVC